MTEHDPCRNCGETVAADAPRGLCPACLLSLALEQHTMPLPSPGDSVQAGAIPEAFVGAGIDRLAPLFPGLELQELLGFGGMGAVYQAKQKKLDRLVALKIIRPEAAANPAFTERFNREARTLARLSHPNIVAIHDFGEVQSADPVRGDNWPLFYFVMEYVDGRNLRQLLEAGPLSPAAAFNIVAQICEALQYAHGEAVVHRDIKPENILLDKRGRVKIADFGLAKLAVGRPDDFTLTGTHQVMGTPRYMAPEQMEGTRSVDQRADIYSLGVVLYEMLTGDVPAGHFEPPSHKAAVSDELDQVVFKALSRDPERRFQHASQLRSAMELAVSPDGVPGLPASELNLAAAEVPAGISSIFSREAVAVKRWVLQPAAPTARPLSAPRWTMLLLSLLPCLMVFLPWFDVYVTDPDATRGLSGQFLSAYQGTIAYHRQISPLELKTGVACGTLLCVLAVFQVLSLGRNHSSSRLAFTGLLISGLALLCILLTRTDLWYWPMTVYGDPLSGDMPRTALNYGHPPGVGDSYLGPLHHQIIYQWPLFTAVGGLLLLMILLGIEIKHAAAARTRQPLPATAARPQRLRSLRTALIVSAVCLMLSAVFTSMWVTDDPHALHLDKRSLSSVVQAYLILAAQAVCFPVSVLTLVVSWGVAEGHYRRLATACCVLLLIPWTPGWLLVLPLATWCLLTLQRPDVVRLFADSPEVPATGSRQTAQQPLSRPAAAASEPLSESAARPIPAPLSGSPATLTPQPVRRRSRLPWLIVSAILLTALLLSFVLQDVADQTPAVPTLISSVQQAETQTAMELLAAGAAPNEAGNDQHSALWWATARSDDQLLEALLRAGADPNQVNSTGVTPLMIAAARGRLWNVVTLIGMGADVNAQDRLIQTNSQLVAAAEPISWPAGQMTALMLAAGFGYAEVAKTLLEAGADPNLRNRNGQTAAELALQRNYPEVHDLILRFGRAPVQIPMQTVPETAANPSTVPE